MALQTLGLIRSESRSTVPVIRPYLEDESGVLRGLAAATLGMLGPGSVDTLPDLRRRFTDDWSMVRVAATNAVRAIETKSKETGRQPQPQQ